MAGIQFDLPLEKLWEHRAESKMPKDFEDFWRKQMIEVQESALNYEMIPLQYPSDQIELFMIKFRSVNCDLIYGYYARPIGNDTHANVLLQYHGYNWAYDGDLNSVVAAAHRGYHSYKMLVRGQQFSENSATSFGNPVGTLTHGIQNKEDYYYKYVFMDVILSIRILDDILKSFKSRKFVAQGGSQGGALAIVAAALSEIKIDAVVSLYPYLSDYRRCMRISPDGPYHEIIEFLRRNTFLDRELIFENLDYFDMVNFANLIECPVLMGVGLVDTLVPPSASFGVFHNLRTRKFIEIYPEFGHEGIPDFDLKVDGFLYNIFENEDYDWSIHPLGDIFKVE